MHVRRGMRDGVIIARVPRGTGAEVITTRKRSMAWLMRTPQMRTRLLTCLAATRMNVLKAAATMLLIAWRRVKLARRDVMLIVSLAIVNETAVSNGAAGAAAGLCPHWCAQLLLLPRRGMGPLLRALQRRLAVPLRRLPLALPRCTDHRAFNDVRTHACRISVCGARGDDLAIARTSNSRNRF